VYQGLRSAGVLLVTTRSMVIPYSGRVDPATLAAAIAKLLGETPGSGLLQLRVVEHAPPPPNEGPGTELKKLLAKIGITPKAGCKCLARAVEMDIRGCDWCADNVPTIVGWLREEATSRRLPFIDAAGTVLVKRAISNARRLHRGQG
jgi:hypothetical protein